MPEKVNAQSFVVSLSTLQAKNFDGDSQDLMKLCPQLGRDLVGHCQGFQAMLCDAMLCDALEGVLLKPLPELTCSSDFLCLLFINHLL